MGTEGGHEPCRVQGPKDRAGGGVRDLLHGGEDDGPCGMRSW
jgi:hypothetical protein